MQRIPRRAARIAVLDPDGAVFMFRYDNVEVGIHWSMPGGGLDPGETPLEGALREVREETGWRDLEPEPGVVLFTWEHDYTRNDGPAVRQFEHVFLARGPRREPVGDLRHAHSLDGILHWRWWAPDELARAEEPLWPPQLPEVLARLDRDGPPARPLELGFVGNEGLVVRHLER